MSNATPMTPSQTLARKRRKEILASHKNGKKQKLEQSEDIKTTTITATTKAKVVKSSTKYQNRYEPGVPMTKEQEAEWRLEARRQRNRESAAASRNKVRNRIEELESEVEDWKGKYSSLLKRIDLLENAMPSYSLTPKTIYVPSSIATSCGGTQTDVICNDLSKSLVSDCGSSSSDSRRSEEVSDKQLLFPIQQQQQQNVTKTLDPHVIEMTSRPAVKITDEDLTFVTSFVDDDNDDGWEHLIPALKEALGVTNTDMIAVTTTANDGELKEEPAEEERCDDEKDIMYDFNDEYNMELLTQDALNEFDLDERDVASLLE
mmetsp:Transcript_27393/g.31325  ORF Transcript_27393/g.31325 Transcript_27393/m.31325 type:complete len:318 (-) Transcript_27393:351-1304(-)